MVGAQVCQKISLYPVDVLELCLYFEILLQHIFVKLVELDGVDTNSLLLCCVGNVEYVGVSKNALQIR